MSKNSRLIRVDPEFYEYLNKVKIDLADRLKVEPVKLKNPIITKKIINWADIGRELENRNRNKKDINKEIAKFLDKLTGIE